MNGDWSDILDDYNKAKKALWCPKEKENWHREEEIGRYYMLKAYHRASEMEEKDYLLYARILAMMADESQSHAFDYDRYHKFVEPSLEAYRLAVKNGQHPTDKELEKIQSLADYLSYELNCKNAPYEEQIKYIHGYEQLTGFGFHDSKPVWFEHGESIARLKLQYHNVLATFLFDGIYDIHVDGDPTANWILDFYCYPCFHNKNIFTFDVEFYKIITSSISVESVEEQR